MQDEHVFSNDRLMRAERLLQGCRQRALTIVTAESCTGGLVAGLLTEIAGSSDVVERGFVAYSNAAKTDALGVPADLIARVGAVSKEVAEAMALGALQASPARLAVAVTGIAGPGGGSAEKPVGLVYLAAARRGGAVIAIQLTLGAIGRTAIRLASVDAALNLLEDLAG